MKTIIPKLSKEEQREARKFRDEKIKDDQNKISFIKGFFDSEGHFSKDYELIAYNKDITKLNLISSFLSDLGLENKINTYTTKNINGNNIKRAHIIFLWDLLSILKSILKR